MIDPKNIFLYSQLPGSGHNFVADVIKSMSDLKVINTSFLKKKHNLEGYGCKGSH
ncbi:MAG: hypothetical protein KDC52_15415 [Ignavibacteriae bacterium]|nr:hypothetical protein [Ignavibacteriota bacterium]